MITPFSYTTLARLASVQNYTQEMFELGRLEPIRIVKIQYVFHGPGYTAYCYGYPHVSVSGLQRYMHPEPVKASSGRVIPQVVVQPFDPNDPHTVRASVSVMGQFYNTRLGEPHDRPA